MYLATDGDLTAMRLLSVLLGAGAIVAGWAALRSLLPRWPVVALSGAGFIAFLPQHLAILGSVSNDPLAELIAALTLLAAVRYVGNRPAPDAAPINPLVLGVLVAAALVTKTTITSWPGSPCWPCCCAAGARAGRCHIAAPAAVIVPAIDRRAVVGPQPERNTVG